VQRLLDAVAIRYAPLFQAGLFVAITVLTKIHIAAKASYFIDGLRLGVELATLASAFETADAAYKAIEQEIELKSAELRKLNRIRRVCRDVRKRAETEAVELGVRGFWRGGRGQLQRLERCTPLCRPVLPVRLGFFEMKSLSTRSDGQ
jgi:hypothetical protein